MRTDWQHYTGFGELLCLVLAWVVAAGAMWADYASRHHSGSGDRVAVSGGETAPRSHLD
jgi:hypothetical protein